MHRQRIHHPPALAAWECLAIFVGAALALFLILPFFVRAHASSNIPSCVNNLRRIAEAKDQWALEKRHSPGEPSIDAEVEKYLKGGRPKCPKGGSYIFGNLGQDPTCNRAGHKLN